MIGRERSRRVQVMQCLVSAFLIGGVSVRYFILFTSYCLLELSMLRFTLVFGARLRCSESLTLD